MDSGIAEINGNRLIWQRLWLGFMICGLVMVSRVEVRLASLTNYCDNVVLHKMQ